MAKHPKTFDDLLSLWASPKELSLALGVSYIDAYAFKRRGTVAVRHWPKLIEGAREKGLNLTAEDLLKMKVAA
jgi:hypothetical protein